MSARRGHDTSLRRRRIGVRTVRKTLLILCEGQRTEPEYFEALKRDPVVRDVAAVDIRVYRGPGMVPLTLVKKATALMASDPAVANEVDEIWCVFDVEWPKNHPNIREALRSPQTFASEETSSGYRPPVYRECHPMNLVHDGPEPLRTENPRRVQKAKTHCRTPRVFVGNLTVA
jgi:hypothetical protein